MRRKCERKEIEISLWRERERHTNVNPSLYIRNRTPDVNCQDGVMVERRTVDPEAGVRFPPLPVKKRRRWRSRNGYRRRTTQRNWIIFGTEAV